MKPEVLIIGGGIVGCALARQLSRYKLRVVLLERSEFLPSGMWNVAPGVISSSGRLRASSREVLYYRKGERLFNDLLETMRLPVSWLEGVMYWRSGGEGFAPQDRCCRLVDGGYLEGRLGSGYWRDYEGIVCEEVGVLEPSWLVLALAQNARKNGVDIRLGVQVLEVVGREGRLERVITTEGEYTPHLVLNTLGGAAWPVGELGGEGDGRGFHFFSQVSLAFSPSFTPLFLERLDGDCVCLPSAFGYWVARMFRRRLLSLEVVEGEDGEVFQRAVEELRRMYPGFGLEDIVDYWTEFGVEEEAEVVSPLEGYYWVRGGGGDILLSLGLVQEVMECVEKEIYLASWKGFDPVWDPLPTLRGSVEEVRWQLLARDRGYGDLVCYCNRVSKAEIARALEVRFGERIYLEPLMLATGAGLGVCRGRECLVNLVLYLREYCSLDWEDFGLDGDSFLFGRR